MQSRLGLETLEVVIGDSQDQTFIVHKSLIVRNSEFFKRGCNGHWAEEEGVIKLPKEKPETFAEYLDWLYLKDRGDVIKAADKLDDTPATFERTIDGYKDLYILGDVLQDYKIKNVMIDAIIDLSRAKSFAPTQIIPEVFAKTYRGDRIRKLLVNYYVYGSEGWLDDKEAGFDLQTGPSEFYLEVIKGLYRKAERRKASQNVDQNDLEDSEPDDDGLKDDDSEDTDAQPSGEELEEWPWLGDRCRYHEHPDGEGACEK